MADFTPPPHRLGTSSAYWLYCDPAGNISMASVRFDTPQGKQVLPCIPDGKGGWQWKALPEPRPPYRLNRLAANPTAPVIVTEGEKAADAAQRLFPDSVATTSSGGANAAGKTDWTPLAGRNVTIWPDADEPGRKYAADVARHCKAAGIASVRIVDVPTDWPDGWDLADPLPEGVTLDTLRQMLMDAQSYVCVPDDDGPAPLVRKVEPATAFPVDALGNVLGAAATAIQDITQAPLSMCGQSVLAAATLATQGLADVQLPRGGGKGRPLSGMFVTVAATGERKSTVDNLALTSVRMQEGALRERYAEQMKDYAIKAQAHEVAAKKAKQGEKGKDSRTAIEANLRALGDPPLPPLQPMLTCTDPTIEGLGKMLLNAWPSLGIFSAEGGTFVGGYGMSKENRLKTAAAMSNLWDGAPFDRVRALDGVSIMVGRRVSAHLMMQPGVADGFLGADDLADQGLLSRLLLAAPDSTAGTRYEVGRKVKPESQPALDTYNAALTALLDAPLPLAEGKRNELAPPVLTFTRDATQLWIQFADHIERQIGDGKNLDPVRGLACKAAEHAARIAGVLTLVENPKVTEISANTLENACELVGFYLQEALRLFGKAAVNADIAKAERVRHWLHESWQETHIALSDLIRSGPNFVRDNATARRMLEILIETGHVQETPQPVTIRDKRRRQSWRIIGKVVA